MEQTIYFRRIVDSIRAAAEDARKAAAIIDHAGLAGAIREIALRQCVEPFLTPSFRCGTGKVIDVEGAMSRQIDLVVHGIRQVPPLMLNIGPSIFPAEICEYIFEIKSKLTATEIRNAIDVARSILALKRFPNHRADIANRWRTVLFAFDSDIEGDELARYLKYDTGATPAFFVLLVLGKGYWFWTDDGWHGVRADSLSDPWQIYPLFITGLMNTLAHVEMSFRPFSPGRYIMSHEIHASKYAIGRSPAEPEATGEKS